MIKRILAGALILFFLAYAPAWLVVLSGALFSLAYPWYIELFAAALILDMIGGAPSPLLHGFLHFYVALSVAILLASAALRSFTSLLPRQQSYE